MTATTINHKVIKGSLDRKSFVTTDARKGFRTDVLLGWICCDNKNGGYFFFSADPTQKGLEQLEITTVTVTLLKHSCLWCGRFVLTETHSIQSHRTSMWMHDHVIWLLET